MRTEVLCISVLKVASGPRVKLASCKSALNPPVVLCISVLRVASGPRVKLASSKSALNAPVVYSTDRSKAVVPVLDLLLVALWFILRGDLFMSYLVSFCSCGFQSF